jgi:hypothetical protein
MNELARVIFVCEPNLINGTEKSACCADDHWAQKRDPRHVHVVAELHVEQHAANYSAYRLQCEKPKDVRVRMYVPKQVSNSISLRRLLHLLSLHEAAALVRGKTSEPRRKKRGRFCLGDDA